MPHTPSQFEQVTRLASEFARLAALRVAQTNALRRQIADANIGAETFAADQQLRATRSKLAQAFSEHAGNLAVNAAFRGSTIGDASSSAAVLSASLRAGRETAIAEANRAATVAAVTARNLFVPEDATLAAIEGGLRGLNVGLSLQSALEEMTQVRRFQRTEVLRVGGGNFGFANVIQDIAFTPGLEIDLGNFDFGLDI